MTNDHHWYFYVCVWKIRPLVTLVIAFIYSISQKWVHPHCFRHIDCYLIMKQCHRHTIWTQCKEAILDKIFFKLLLNNIVFSIGINRHINVLLMFTKVTPPLFTLIVKKWMESNRGCVFGWLQKTTDYILYLDNQGNPCSKFQVGCLTHTHTHPLRAFLALSLGLCQKKVVLYVIVVHCNWHCLLSRLCISLTLKGEFRFLRS